MELQLPVMVMGDSRWTMIGLMVADLGYAWLNLDQFQVSKFATNLGF